MMPVSFDLTRIPYSRRDCRLSVSAWEKNGVQQLYLCALLAGVDAVRPGQAEPRQGRLFPVILQKNGKAIPYAVQATISCIYIKGDGCSARIVLQKGDILRVEAIGADVVFAPELLPHELAKDRGDGSWEICMKPVPKLLFCPIKGNLVPETSFDVVTSMPGATKMVFHQDEACVVDLAIHMYRSNAHRLHQYPTFDFCIQEFEQEFTEYLAVSPVLPEEWIQQRELAVYLVWQHIQKFNTGIEAVYMNRGIHRAAFSWQQSYQAMGQLRNPKLAWHMLTSMFRYQDDWGMLPDNINDITEDFGGTKPPIQGLTYLFLREFADFSFVSMTEYREFYENLSRAVYWWMSYRDTDHDGLAQFDSPDESGWDDCSLFTKGMPLATADLATYLVLAMNALAVIAREMNKEFEANEWQHRSDEMLEKMLSFFWNGDQFIARRNSDHMAVESKSAAIFIPLLLGNRLPGDIQNRMIEMLMEEGKWLTPYGIAGEALDSDFWRESGWLAGPILAPVQLLVCLGLRACGRKDLACDIAKRYCTALRKSDFAMIMSAIDGHDVSEGRWKQKYPNRMSWTALVFLLLGELFL